MSQFLVTVRSPAQAVGQCLSFKTERVEGAYICCNDHGDLLVLGAGGGRAAYAAGHWFQAEKVESDSAA